MTITGVQAFPSDDCISTCSGSWQSINSDYSYIDSPRLSLPTSQGYYMPHQDPSARLPPEIHTTSLHVDRTSHPIYRNHHRDVSTAPQYAASKPSQSINTCGNDSIPQAWSTTGEPPSNYIWIPDYDFQPDWTGPMYAGQNDRITEDLKETGAMFQPRIWKSLACNKDFEKRHALNKHMRCHVKAHVCPTPGCDFQAYLKKDVRRHINSVHGAMKIPCPVKDCEYSQTGSKRGVSRKDALKRHMENHKADDSI